MNLLKPPRLQPGDTVAAISLSSGLAGSYPQVYETAKRTLEETFGLTVIPTPHALRDEDWLYEHPERRADDLHWALTNPKVKGIFSCIGGYESVRILPFLKEEVIREHPKVFMGFSDSTVQHMAFFSAGVASFYGPSMLAGLSSLKAYPYTLESVHKTLFTAEPVGRLEPAPTWTETFLDWNTPDYAAKAGMPQPLQQGEGWVWLQGEARGEGHLLGGCADVLEMLKGTRWWPPLEDWRGAVLYLETSEEAPPPNLVEYWLRNYASQGILPVLSALLLARPYGYTDEMKEELYRVVKKVLAEGGLEGLPVVANMDFGHTSPMMVLPNGCRVSVDPVARRVEVLEAGVD